MTWSRDFPSFGMYSDEGDIAVHRMVTLIVSQINLGQLLRVDLPERIRQGCDWVAKEAGHAEVFDTEPQCDIEDTVNRACLAQGWLPVSRWDW